MKDDQVKITMYRYRWIHVDNFALFNFENGLLIENSWKKKRGSMQSNSKFPKEEMEIIPSRI